MDLLEASKRPVHRKVFKPSNFSACSLERRQEMRQSAGLTIVLLEKQHSRCDLTADPDQIFDQQSFHELSIGIGALTVFRTVGGQSGQAVRSVTTGIRLLVHGPVNRLI